MKRKQTRGERICEVRSKEIRRARNDEGISKKG